MINERSFRMGLMSVLLMGISAENYPPYRITPFNWAYSETGYPKPGEDAQDGEIYRHALGFLDRFIAEAAQRGVTLRHRLDAQSVVWALHSERDRVDEGERRRRGATSYRGACGARSERPRPEALSYRQVPPGDQRPYWRRRNRSSSRGHRARARPTRHGRSRTISPGLRHG